MYDPDDLPRFEPMRKRARIHKGDSKLLPQPRCITKNGFKTKARAEKKRLHLMRGNIPYLRVYRCPHCKNFHLTSQQPRS